MGHRSKPLDSTSNDIAGGEVPSVTRLLNRKSLKRGGSPSPGSGGPSSGTQLSTNAVPWPEAQTGVSMRIPIDLFAKPSADSPQGEAAPQPAISKPAPATSQDSPVGHAHPDQSQPQLRALSPVDSFPSAPAAQASLEIELPATPGVSSTPALALATATATDDRTVALSASELPLAGTGSAAQARSPTKVFRRPMVKPARTSAQATEGTHTRLSRSPLGWWTPKELASSRDPLARDLSKRFEDGKIRRGLFLTWVKENSYLASMGFGPEEAAFDAGTLWAGLKFQWDSQPDWVNSLRAAGESGVLIDPAASRTDIHGRRNVLRVALGARKGERIELRLVQNPQGAIQGVLALVLS